MDIHKKSTVSRSTAKIFKILCRVVIASFKCKDPIRLMQKTYLFPLQIGMLANASMHLKSVRYTHTVLFLTIANAVNVQSPDIGKPDIYRRKD
jgi:hypothetical protein